MSEEHESEVRGRCYCGNVRFHIPGTAAPLLAGYCHCLACRQAHAAPIYAVAWLAESDFGITQGQESLKWYTRSQPSQVHLKRYFCLNCGTRVYNHYVGPFSGHQVSAAGVFPSLFEDQSVAKSERWSPRIHMHCEESLIDLTQFADGLPKLPKGAAAT